jgi:hypothetical protein
LTNFCLSILFAREIFTARTDFLHPLCWKLGEIWQGWLIDSWIEEVWNQVHLECASIGFCNWFPRLIDSWPRSTSDRIGKGRRGDCSSNKKWLLLQLM